MSLFTILCLLFFSSVLSSPIRHSEKQISASVFSCESSNELLNAICAVGLREVNAELQAAGISITRDGILFSFDDPQDKTISTGHSCTVTAKTTHVHFSAKLSSTSSLDLNGNSLIEPLLIRVQLPVSFSARVDVKQRFGIRILGSCSNTGSDSYALKGSVGTAADIIVGFSLNPSLGMLDSGDYGLVLEPKVAVVTKLRNTAISFRVSGVSPLSAVWTHVVGVSSTILKAITAVFTGESIKDIVGNALLFDYGIPILLGVGALPNLLEQFIWNRILNLAEHIIDKKSKGFGPDLEDKLQADINSALKVRGDGKRVIVIKRDIVNLFRLSGVAADVFIRAPVDPSVDCDRRAKQACSSGDLNHIYTVCIPLLAECKRLRETYQATHTPPNVIVSKPKIAAFVTTPPPTTIPTTTNGTFANSTFSTNCNPRPGQEVEC